MCSTFSPASWRLDIGKAVCLRISRALKSPGDVGDAGFEGSSMHTSGGHPFREVHEL